MLVLAIVTGLPLYSAGAPLLLAAGVGGTCGVCAVWFLAYATHRIWKHVTPPFSAGDLVVVMGGRYLGKKGTVRAWGRRGAEVDLQDQPGPVVFRRHEIQKL